MRSRRAPILGATVCAVLVLALASAGDAVRAAQTAPDLATLLARARITDTPLASCRGEFRIGHGGEYAAALPAAAPEGRYVIVQDDGTIADLAAFSGKPDLSCYSLREADRLNDTIARSTTMNGRVTAEWDGTVVCGFIEPTIAICWQFAPEERRFARIGGWTT